MLSACARFVSGDARTCQSACPFLASHAAGLFSCLLYLVGQQLRSLVSTKCSNLTTLTKLQVTISSIQHHQACHCNFLTPDLCVFAGAQVVWVVNELIRRKANETELDKIFGALVRMLGGGDTSTDALNVCARFVVLLQQQRAWLLQRPNLVPLIFFTLLRLIMDHGSSASTKVLPCFLFLCTPLAQLLTL